MAKKKRKQEKRLNARIADYLKTTANSNIAPGFTKPGSNNK